MKEIPINDFENQEIANVYHDYFYGDESQRYVFYRIPKYLITEPCYEDLSTDAKLLYGLFLDRMSLSMMNHWSDDQGRVYIYYTYGAIQRDLHCGSQKVRKLLDELEMSGLIEIARQGQGKPSRIYTKSFEAPRKSKNRFFENQTSRNSKIKEQEVRKSKTNNTNKNKTEINKTDLILSGDGFGENEIDWRSIFTRQLEVDLLKERFMPDRDIIDGILDIIVDIMRSKKKHIRVSGEDIRSDIVKSRFMQLTADHLQYVLLCIKKNNTKVRNVRQYLLATLYNAPVTIGIYYQAEVNHDLAKPKEDGKHEEGGVPDDYIL